MTHAILGILFSKNTTVNQAFRNESPSGAIMSVANQPHWGFHPNIG